jgi:hypothetical protein
MTLSLDGRDFMNLAHERDVSVLTRRIETDSLPESDTKDVPPTRLRNHLIVGKAAREIARALGNKECVIATARIRSGIKGNLLHPVATWPRRLNSYFLDPKQYEGFTFDPTAFEDDASIPLDCNHSAWRGRLYNLAKVRSQEPRSDTFAKRIKDFLSSIDPHSYGLDNDTFRRLQETGTCVVLGGVRPDAEFVPPRRNAQEFYYFFALYLIPPPEDQDHSIDNLGDFVDKMFRALEVSERVDKEDFERDGLQLLSELIPVLADPDMAPSDAIAFFLKKLSAILRKHTLGVADRHTWVHFLAIDTILDPTSGAQTPRFHVFPHREATGSKSRAIGSFLVSHPKRLSTVKLIVRQWARHFNVKLSAEFESLFKEIKVPDGIFDVSSKSACFSADDEGDLWDEINLDVTPDDQKTQCTLGFVIEKRSARLTVPYALIAFESDLPDAFSREDIDRFRAVIDACSNLLLGLHLSSASFDIKEKIRDAFSDTSTLPRIGNHVAGKSSRTPIAFGRFCFELLRVDRDRLLEIIESPNQRIWAGSGLSKQDAKDYVAQELQHMPGGPDDAIGERRNGDDRGPRVVFDSTLRARDKWIAENETRLHTIWDKSGIAGDIYEFLAHVPSNIVWHCYLNAVSRAIADRAGAGEAVEPKFMVMQHGGRSALAMFVFSRGPQEFRQIIKLSDRDKIWQEAENYRKYVRYNVPLSARLPFSGKAYEADGNTEDSAGDIESIPISSRSFGALVSDLIAGSRDEEGPVTFLHKVIELVNVEKRAVSRSSSNGNPIDDFRAAIKYQFENNTSRWQVWTDRDKWVPNGSGVDNTVREITRIHIPDEQSSIEKIDSRLGVYEFEYEHALRVALERLVRLPFDAVSKAMHQFDRAGTHLAAMNALDLGSIIHGDLNARNLVWSKDYVKFFMIDFEKVRLGFFGADQLRLAFSLLADLSVEAYQIWNRSPAVGDEEVSRHVSQAGKIADDLGKAVEYAGAIVLAVKNARNTGVGPIHIPRAPDDSVSAMAIEEMFKTTKLRKENSDFWLFAIAMTSIKQLEYALRDVDESCLEMLTRMQNGTVQEYNLYKYYTSAELREENYNRFVMGKIARVLFAYRAFARVVNPQEYPPSLFEWEAPADPRRRVAAGPRPATQAQDPHA